ncbi:Predicted dithiol-disulfide isomerase, DsbA family [Lentzea fradiae]|uniref:Predicted dithiol-disulfide isomerase, DsbA family n=1 Tax=Lentzea fradiae TaxID=200378 RepID=A0A1G7KE11_9PSEU|nr:DsbA family oxidoreductase [Lentzea fradiae]SDF35405.1 Predicted dithiol-disulfide isomerase, DsbA family [Lentzea fradiae]
MQVEIWADVVCPWCYIGKARFDKALAGFEHRDEVEVVHRSFELDPGRAADDVVPVTEMLTAKFGPQAAGMDAGVAELAEAEGLGYRRDRVVGNTFDVHRLLHLAGEHGLRDELTTAAFHANFAEARSLFTTGDLVDLAVKGGLDGEEARAALADPHRFAEDVRADQRLAREIGISGVPFFLLGRTHAVSGAQSVELLTSALRQAWDAQPKST